MTTAITPCLWFDGQGEAAANFYVALFPNSRIESISRYAEGSPLPPGFPPGTAMLVRFSIDGQPFSALNGGPQFPHSEAVSFVVPVADQAELDRIWDGLIAHGGAEGQCGWCKDRFGVSWQVLPAALARMMDEGTPEQLGRLFGALMPMTKLDVAALEAAFEGRI